MKNHFGHILFFSLIAALLAVASVLTYGQYVSDSQKEAAYEKVLAEHDYEAYPTTVIDTTRFFENPCYEYCATERDEENGVCVDNLKKTVLSVKQNGRELRNITPADLKSMPSNASLNMMLESYTVSRIQDSCKTSFYVTVESFDAILEKVKKDPSLLSDPDRLYESSILENFPALLNQECPEEWVLKVHRRDSRPL